MSTAEPPTIFGGNLEDGSLYGWVWILGKKRSTNKGTTGTCEIRYSNNAAHRPGSQCRVHLCAFDPCTAVYDQGKYCFWKDVAPVVLAPDSLKVNSCAEEFLDEQKFDKRARVRKQPCGYPELAFFLTPLTSEEQVGAFWFVETTEDKAKANMVWATAHHTNTGGIGFTLPQNLAGGQLNARINGKQAVATGIASAQQGLTYLTEGSVGTVLRVPVLVNRKPLKPGDVLLVLDAKKGGKRTREAVPIQVSGLVKRLKTDGCRLP